MCEVHCYRINARLAQGNAVGKPAWMRKGKTCPGSAVPVRSLASKAFLLGRSVGIPKRNKLVAKLRAQVAHAQGFLLYQGPESAKLLRSVRTLLYAGVRQDIFVAVPKVLRPSGFLMGEFGQGRQARHDVLVQRATGIA
jgi:hypothetical protein